MYNKSKQGLLSIAKQYALAGLSSFPVHTLEGEKCSCGNAACGDIAKHPLTVHGAKDATKDNATLERYFTGDYAKANIACATGDPSGVLVLDVDDPESFKAFQTAYGACPQTWCVQTQSGGYHYYFRHDEHTQALKNATKFHGSLDVRTTGGYVILPPSVGESGKRYTWIVSPDDCEIATLPAKWLDVMPQHGKETQATTQTIQRATSPIERCIAYLAKVPPAISGQGGHGKTFGVVCGIVELFGTLSEDELLTALETWNVRCDPPWNEGELRHKLRDARAKTNVTQSATQTEKNEQNVESRKPLCLCDSAYIGILGDIVKAVEPQTEADPAGVLVSLLVCIGSYVGKRPTFSVGGDTHHANLFAALVGDTASGKGLAWGVARYVMKGVDRTWMRDDIAYGLSSGEGLVERICDPRHEDEETTIHTPSAVLTLPPERRLLCLETEFAKPITAMRREGNTLSALLRSAWDGQPLEVLTRGKSRVRASNAHVSILAHVTADELSKLLAKSVETTNGFANRFLWCNVRSSKDLPQGGNVSVVDPFIAPLRQALNKAKAIGTMTRSTQADMLWNDVYSSLKHGTDKVTERGRPQTLRLAMIYALADGLSVIEERHLTAALAVWRYCEDSALSLFNGDNLANRLRETIRQRPGIMRSELRHSVSHSITTPTFDHALRWLVRRGDVICVQCYEERQAERYYPALWGRSATNEDVSVSRDASTSEAYVPTSHVSTCDATEAVTPASPTSLRPTQTQPLTLGELLDWRNEYGIRFVRRPDGMVWVTGEHVERLTPALEQAITANQETLSFLVSDGETYHDVAIADAGDTLTSNEDDTLSVKDIMALLGEDEDESWAKDLERELQKTVT